MSKKSDYSKNLNIKLWIARITDIVILVLPLVVFFVMAMINEEAVVVEKVALVGTSAIAIILTIFNLLAKAHLRSVIWIAVIGIYLCLDDILPLILCIAAATIIDEFVLSPLIKTWKTKYLASRTMDDRGIQ